MTQLADTKDQSYTIKEATVPVVSRLSKIERNYMAL